VSRSAKSDVTSPRAASSVAVLLPLPVLLLRLLLLLHTITSALQKPEEQMQPLLPLVISRLQALSSATTAAATSRL
jgi:hypothetical protein